MSVPSRCSASVNGPAIRPYRAMSGLASRRVRAARARRAYAAVRGGPGTCRSQGARASSPAGATRPPAGSRGPGQLAADGLGLDLQIERHRHAVGLVSLDGGLQPLNHEGLGLEVVAGLGPDERGGMAAHERHPRNAIDCFPAQRGQDSCFGRYERSLHIISFATNAARQPVASATLATGGWARCLRVAG